MKDRYEDLFDSRTISRLSSAIKPTLKQKFSAREWISLLESGALAKEKKNYLKFASIVLQGILGYSIEKDLGFEEGNVEFSFRKPSGEGGICFEAKGTKTQDLFANQNREKPEHRTPVKQTWDNMGRNNFDYGVATNYRDFVLIDRSKGYLRYHLIDFLNLKGNEAKLKEFIAIFSKDSVIDRNFLPKLLYESSIEERIFTGEFYKLYHETRLMLLKEYGENGGLSGPESLHFAQVCLNRLIFMFFAQGTGKLKRRLFSESLLESLNPALVSEYSHYASDTILNLFERMDKGSTAPTEIFGFNGGLFSERIPPNVFFKDMRNESHFKDILLHSELKKDIKLDEVSDMVVNRFRNRLSPIVRNLLLLSSFDFQSEVNVNILGHIFEQSLTDLEELQESKKISKRKKEGIFYTPEYVTEYICKETILPWFSTRGSNTVESLIEEYHDNIEALEEKFQRIKIVDPACGSGAFLLKAVSILLELDKAIRAFKESKGDYTASVSKRKRVGSSDYFRLEKWNEEEEARTIIENNIFGVDINEESVEITKLSLFLKIASKDRKLIDLSSNIRVGNSLIEDEKIAGAKAFVWKREFPHVFSKGGFDVIIGNPPYVRVQELDYRDIDYFKASYAEIAHLRIDISIIFFGLAFRILNSNGKIGFISSSQFMTAEYGRNLRRLLLSKRIESMVDFGSLRVFQDAITYAIIMILSDEAPAEFEYARIAKLDESVTSNLGDTLRKGHDTNVERVRVKPDTMTEEVWNFVSSSEQGVLSRLTGREDSVFLGEFANPSTGITTGLDEALMLSEEELKEEGLERPIFIKVLRGRNIDPWLVKGPFDYAFYPYRLKDGETELIPERELKDSYPKAYSYVLGHKKELLERKDSRRTVAENKDWYGLIRKGKLNVFNNVKIVTPALTKHNSFAIDDSSSAYLTGGAGVFAMVQERFDNKFLLGILNSKLIEYFLHSIATKKQNDFYSYLNSFLSQIPVINAGETDQIAIAKNVQEVMRVTEQLEAAKRKFWNRLLEAFPGVSISQKLVNFQELEVVDFMKELSSRTERRLFLKEADEWEDYFSERSAEVKELGARLRREVDQVDEAVFDLYGMDEDERKLVRLKTS